LLTDAERLFKSFLARNELVASVLRDFCGLRLLDRSPHLVAPFRPRAVVILHVLESQKLRQNKPRMTRALANPAVNHGVLRWVEAEIINVNLPKFFNRFERS